MYICSTSYSSLTNLNAVHIWRRHWLGNKYLAMYWFYEFDWYYAQAECSYLLRHWNLELRSWYNETFLSDGVCTTGDVHATTTNERVITSCSVPNSCAPATFSKPWMTCCWFTDLLHRLVSLWSIAIRNSYLTGHNQQYTLCSSPQFFLLSFFKRNDSLLPSQCQQMVACVAATAFLIAVKILKLFLSGERYSVDC